MSHPKARQGGPSEPASRPLTLAPNAAEHLLHDRPQPSLAPLALVARGTAAWHFLPDHLMYSGAGPLPDDIENALEPVGG